MGGGLFPRIKIWGSTDTVTNTDLNAEFNNIITNFVPLMMDDYSETVSQMQIQTNPGNLGSESQPTSLAGELERLRFQLAAITGNTLWYQPPAFSLSNLGGILSAASAQNTVISGTTEASSSQPVFLVAQGAQATVTLTASATIPFNYKIAGSTFQITANTTLTGLTSATASNNTMNVTDPMLGGGASSFLVGENGSTLTVGSMGSAISALVGKYAAFQTANSEYVIGLVSSTTSLTNAFRGYFFNSSSALVARAAVNNLDSWTLLSLAWLYVTTSKTLTVSYTNPSYGPQPSSPAIGDYWYNQSTNLWMTYNGSSWVAANATLVGVAIINSSGACVGTRCVDFFGVYSALNTVEVQTVSLGTSATMGQTGSQISVYGTSLSFGNSNNFTWNTAVNMDSGSTFSANAYYYFYLTQAGIPVVSSTAPFDRRNDLQGYYHPAHAWRCVGQAFTDNSFLLGTVFDPAGADSFFRENPTKPVIINGGNSSVISMPNQTWASPFGPQQTVELFECSAPTGTVGVSYTQTLPPPSQWKGRRMIFQKQDSNFAQIGLRAYGTIVLTTTFSAIGGATTFTTASTAGLTTNKIYLASGPVMPCGATASLGSNGTITTSAPVNCFPNNSGGGNAPVAGISFSLVPGLPTSLTTTTTVGIGGYMTTGISTQGEALELYSDGVGAQIVHRHIPSQWQSFTLTVSASATAPTLGANATVNAKWRRRGCDLEVQVNLNNGNTGTAGSGEYLWQFPVLGTTSLAVNTFQCNLTNTSTTESTALSIVGAMYLSISGTVGTGVAILGRSDATANGGPASFRLLHGNGFIIGSGAAPFSAIGIYQWFGSAPILGWAENGS